MSPPTSYTDASAESRTAVNTNSVPAPRFGVNYVPSRNWWYCWNDWDTESVLEDFQALAGLGLDHIRIQLVWPVFQPNPAMVSAAALERLRELMDLADRADTGLDVMVTVLTGWLSGFTFKPAWIKNRCMATDEDAIAAELHLIDVLAAEVADHPRFLGFDLGNELSVINDGVSVADGDRWAARLLDHCDKVAPGGFHVNGNDHRPWLDNTVFSPRGAATSGSASIFHSYPFWSGMLAKWGPDGAGTLHLGEFMAELAEAHAPAPGRPKWLQEFGSSPVERPEASIPDWTEAFVRQHPVLGRHMGLHLVGQPRHRPPPHRVRRVRVRPRPPDHRQRDQGDRRAAGPAHRRRPQGAPAAASTDHGPGAPRAGRDPACGGPLLPPHRGRHPPGRRHHRPLPRRGIPRPPRHHRPHRLTTAPTPKPQVPP